MIGISPESGFDCVAGLALAGGMKTVGYYLNFVPETVTGELVGNFEKLQIELLAQLQEGYWRESVK